MFKNCDGDGEDLGGNLVSVEDDNGDSGGD